MAADATYVVVFAGGDSNIGWTGAPGGPDLVLSGAGIVARLGHLYHVVYPGGEVEHKGVAGDKGLTGRPIRVDAGVGWDGPPGAAPHNMARRCRRHRGLQ